jgi:hypothetical protein
MRPASCNKKVRWAETVVENKLRPTYNTPPLPAHAKQPIRFSSPDPKAEELHHFLQVHEPSRLHECDAIVARYRQNGRVDFLMRDMKAHYGCCSRRCRLCASGAMDEGALLLELSKCGPVPVAECGTFGESYSGEDLEALLVMCGGRDESRDRPGGLGGAAWASNCDNESPFMHHSHQHPSRDSSISSACSFSSASSSPVLHGRGSLSEQNPEKYNDYFAGMQGGQGDDNSPPLMQYRREDATEHSRGPAVVFRVRDCRVESDPFDECDFGDFDMH